MERARQHAELGEAAAMNDMANAGGLQPVPMMMNGGLPAAILAQYPALQGLQWDDLGMGAGDDGGEISGRSSFDASSGGEGFFDDEGDGGVEYLGHGGGPVGGMGLGVNEQGRGAWAEV